jgi:hypothetical protein
LSGIIAGLCFRRIFRHLGFRRVVFLFEISISQWEFTFLQKSIHPPDIDKSRAS